MQSASMKLSLAPLLILTFVLGACQSTSPSPEPQPTTTMELGAFSVSLAVQDLAASRAFYEKLGFEQLAGEPAQNWIILKNGQTVIGLFQGMFPNNIMTFNPGWDQSAQNTGSFTDVRELQARLMEQGIEPVTKADPDSTGPASFVLVDPDGNSILVDQHR